MFSYILLYYETQHQTVEAIVFNFKSTISIWVVKNKQILSSFKILNQISDSNLKTLHHRWSIHIFDKMLYANLKNKYKCSKALCRNKNSPFWCRARAKARTTIASTRTTIARAMVSWKLEQARALAKTSRNHTVV